MLPSAMTLRRPLLTIVALAVALLLPSAAPADPPTAVPLQTVKVGPATLGYRDLNPSAKGTPLVLVTGYGATAAEWHPAFVERLARGRRTIVFDNRGIGNSSGPTKGLTIEVMADDTAGLIRELGLGRADVLGWSMGGYIGQVLALEHPRLVRRLILASSDPGSPKAVPPGQRVIDALSDPAQSPQQLLPLLFPPDQQAAGEAWLTAIGQQPNLTAADFATPGPAMAAQTRAVGPRWFGRGHGAYDRLPELRQPTLVAFGRRDVVAPPANGRILARRIPNATKRAFADAGHAFLFQQPTRKAALFARYLDR
jgi:pimeloyl-ACP methyl ester carboxylesterase